MRAHDFNPHELIYLRKNKNFADIYDVLLNNVQQCKQFDSFECHFTLYPYDRRINSGNFKINPFEEYVNDILSNHRSVYERITENTGKIFGAFLGAVITAAFAIFKPEILVSVESVVSIFAAYTFGKEFWQDIQNGLIRITKNKRLSYTENSYSYVIEKKTTLTGYSTLARQKRLDFYSELPYKFDSVLQNSSQTLRVKYLSADLAELKEDRLHLFSIRLDPSKTEIFERNGFLFGVKISLNKHLLGFRKSYEMFQSFNQNELGCLDNSNAWQHNTIFYRNTISHHRLKFFKKNGLLRAKTMLKKNF